MEIEIELLKKINKSIRIYDNGGKTFDRFTAVWINRPYSTNKGDKLRECLGMSERPFSPLGFCMYGGAMLGRHLGKKITFEQLPDDCQKAIINDFEH